MNKEVLQAGLSDFHHPPMKDQYVSDFQVHYIKLTGHWECEKILSSLLLYLPKKE